ncbi:UNVERIFIED_CONTAM: hypothetical protein FKN15_041982 [Acipenser sinensis]
MREKAIRGKNIGVSNEKMGKGQRQKITKNMDSSEEELEELEEQVLPVPFKGALITPISPSEKTLKQ